jgi:hypothetical protein
MKKCDNSKIHIYSIYKGAWQPHVRNITVTVHSPVRKLFRNSFHVHRIDNVRSVFHSFRKCFVRRDFMLIYVSFEKLKSHGKVGCWLTDADRNVALPF